LRAIFNHPIKNYHKKAKLWINKYSKKSLSKKNKKEKTERCKMISKKKKRVIFLLLGRECPFAQCNIPTTLGAVLKMMKQIGY
jgi:hypothetical protein